MAQRRMFSIRLTNSARFLRMPISSQALYFHLGLHADDDGVVEAYPIIKTVGCTEDDLRVLVARGFVRVLNDDLVTYITDWNEHNKIRADRKIDSIYKDLLLELVPDVQLLEKKPRADRPGTSQGQIMDGQGTAQDRLGKDRLGKDSIGKDRLLCASKPKTSELKSEFEALWKLYPKKQGKDKAFGYYERARKSGVTYEEVEQGILNYKDHIKNTNTPQQYIKMGSTYFSQKAWNDEYEYTPVSTGNPFMDMLNEGGF